MSVSEGQRKIGMVENYYSGISIFERHGKYFWVMDDPNRIVEEEITEDLFKALNQFEDAREKKHSSKSHNNQMNNDQNQPH